MGGFGSGRSGGAATSEGTASYVITASMLTRAGRGVTGVAHFDGGSFWVAMRVDISNPSDAFVELTHQTRDKREGDRIVRDRIRLVSTVPTYGRRRWWFQCPRTGRRTTKLFLPNGGWHFRSRQAYRLGYACQREERADRRDGGWGALWHHPRRAGGRHLHDDRRPRSACASSVLAALSPRSTCPTARAVSRTLSSASHPCVNTRRSPAISARSPAVNISCPAGAMSRRHQSDIDRLGSLDPHRRHLPHPADSVDAFPYRTVSSFHQRQQLVPEPRAT
jgi:hypothetical protein